MFLSGITPGIVNKIGPHNIDLYPNYLWVYTHHHFTASFAQILALLMSYQRRAKLRAFVQRQFTQVVNQALPKLAMKYDLEARQRADLMRDIAPRMLPSEGPVFFTKRPSVLLAN